MSNSCSGFSPPEGWALGFRDAVWREMDRWRAWGAVVVVRIPGIARLERMHPRTVGLAARMIWDRFDGRPTVRVLLDGEWTIAAWEPLGERSGCGDLMGRATEPVWAGGVVRPVAVAAWVRGSVGHATWQAYQAVCEQTTGAGGLIRAA